MVGFRNTLCSGRITHLGGPQKIDTSMIQIRFNIVKIRFLILLDQVSDI
jgi:hypothetical protein